MPSPRKVDKSTLGFLGQDFQMELVKCFFEDKGFFESLSNVVDQNMFTDQYLRKIVAEMKQRYLDKSVILSYRDAKFIFAEKLSNAVERDECLATIDRIASGTLESMDIVEETSQKFFRQQNLIRAINQAQDIIKEGDYRRYYEIEGLFQQALEDNTKRVNAFRIFDSIEADLAPNYRVAITTGCKELDLALAGGLSRGEMGIVVAPPGVGKSSMMTGFAAAAATCRNEDNNYQGYKVLHFFFEDEPVNIRRKYFGWLTQIDAADFDLPDVTPRVREMLDMESDEKKLIEANIWSERLPTGEVSASEIKQRVNQYIAKGFRPDLVIIDYFECLKPEKAYGHEQSEWSAEGVTIRKLESMANELSVAVWVPVQGTKGSIGMEYVGLMHAGGSVKKTQVGHIVLQLAQTDEQKVRGRLNLFIGKFRAGRMTKNKFLDVQFNNGTCRLDMSDPDDDFGSVNISQQSPMSVGTDVARSVLREQRRQNK